jgi:hypothetical protein
MSNDELRNTIHFIMVALAGIGKETFRFQFT